MIKNKLLITNPIFQQFRFMRFINETLLKFSICYSDTHCGFLVSSGSQYEKATAQKVSGVLVSVFLTMIQRLVCRDHRSYTWH